MKIFYPWTSSQSADYEQREKATVLRDRTSVLWSLSDNMLPLLFVVCLPVILCRSLQVLEQFRLVYPRSVLHRTDTESCTDICTTAGRGQYPENSSGSKPFHSNSGNMKGSRLRASVSLIYDGGYYILVDTSAATDLKGKEAMLRGIASRNIVPGEVSCFVSAPGPKFLNLSSGR